MSDESQEIVDDVRRLSGVPEGTGPDDTYLLAGVRGFVSAFNYWYIRVIKEAVPDYRKLVIARINPFIRRVEFGGLSADRVATRLVEDYTRRNFVTAGGWALEELAIAGSARLQKSAAEGIDAQRLDAVTNAYHLYVLKSGTVTRNSDIVRAIKTHGRQAEKLLRQGRGTTGVHLNYVILAGKTSSTFEDGVNRPSSAEFWAEAFNLNEEDAIELALAMSTVAGRMVTSDASVHIDAMKVLVASYVSRRDDEAAVDWDFIAKRVLQKKSEWNIEDRDRHTHALAALEAAGYKPKSEGDDTAARIAEKVAELEPSAEALSDETSAPTSN